MQAVLPDYYNIIPPSYLLPSQEDEFERDRTLNPQCTYLVKPDCGALGAGISILDPGDVLEDDSYSVAQRYLESKVISRADVGTSGLPVNTKFDFRVFVLITSLNDYRFPEVYVYKDGLSRFCSEEYDSRSQYGRLTNTAINKKNKSITIESITRSMQQVLEVACGRERSRNVMDRINRAIHLTVLSAAPYYDERPVQLRHSRWRLRCFQLVGFDVLLDEALNPFILEANFRPSLGRSASVEAMKKQLVIDALHIVVASGNPRDAAWDHFLATYPSEGGFIKLSIDDPAGDGLTFKDIATVSRQLGAAYDTDEASVGPLKMPAEIPPETVHLCKERIRQYRQGRERGRPSLRNSDAAHPEKAHGPPPRPVDRAHGKRQNS
jgi:hypothetical protein